MLEGIEDVVRQAREEIDHKPAFQIVHADNLGVGHHLSGGADKRCVKIEYDVNEEDHVHDAVCDQQRYVVHSLAFEGHVERNHDCSVEGEDKYDPIPGGLEGGIMQDNVRWSLWSFLSVLRKNVCVQIHHLQRKIKTLWSSARKKSHPVTPRAQGTNLEGTNLEVNWVLCFVFFFFFFFLQKKTFPLQNSGREPLTAHKGAQLFQNQAASSNVESRIAFEVMPQGENETKGQNNVLSAENNRPLGWAAVFLFLQNTHKKYIFVVVSSVWIPCFWRLIYRRHERTPQDYFGGECMVMASVVSWSCEWRIEKKMEWPAIV